MHQVTLEHNGEQLWGDLLSLRYNMHGRTLTACCIAKGCLGMYILAAMTLTVVDVILCGDLWVNDIWWFTDASGAFRIALNCIQFFHQRQTEPMELLRQYSAPSNSFVRNAISAGSCFAFVGDLDATSYHVELHDNHSHNLIAKYTDANALEMHIEYSRRHHVIVITYRARGCQVLRLLGADDLQVVANGDVTGGASLSCTRLTALHPTQSTLNDTP